MSGLKASSFAEIEGMYWYKANDDAFRPDKWQPSLFMPKAACRIFLQITYIRVERLQDIKQSDCLREGIEYKDFPGGRFYKTYCTDKNSQGIYDELMPKHSFETLWQSINGKESWNKNPFVWVVEFK